MSTQTTLHAPIPATTGKQRENLSAVLHAPRTMKMERRALPPPGPDEVTIRVRATGLCGSDLHYYQLGRNGDFAMQHPICPGHESVGDVVAYGANVPETLPQLTVPGARAAIEPGINCTACEYCLSGRYNLCPKLRFASSAKTLPHLDGSLQRYVNWPARLAHAIPPTMSLHAAALIEPLAVVLQALSRSKLEPGQSVLIFGAGAVGLLACAASKAFGASFVAAVDIDQGRLDFARQNGWADATYCSKPGPKPAQPNGANGATTEPLSRQDQDKQTMAAAKAQADDIIATISASSPTAAMTVGGAGGFDVVYECTGVPSCTHASIFASRLGGRVCLIGMGHPIMAMPIGSAATREVDIFGVFRYCNMFPKAIRLISSGALPSKQVGPGASATSGKTASMGDIANLVSHTYPLERAIDAFETLHSGKSPDGKLVVKILVVNEGEEETD